MIFINDDHVIGIKKSDLRRQIRLDPTMYLRMTEGIRTGEFLNYPDAVYKYYKAYESNKLGQSVADQVVEKIDYELIAKRVVFLLKQ